MARIPSLVWAVPLTLALLVLAKGALEQSCSPPEQKAATPLTRQLVPPGRLHAPQDARPVLPVEAAPLAIRPASTAGALSLSAPAGNEAKIVVRDAPREMPRSQSPPSHEPPLVYPIVESDSPPLDSPPQLAESFPGPDTKTDVQRLPADAAVPQRPGSTFAATGAPVSDQALSAVREQVAAMNRKAVKLAQRGALYSARAELLEALRLLAQTHDAHSGTTQRTSALAAALTAMEEADDFTPTKAGAAVNPGDMIRAHQTPVLKRIDAARLAPLTCSQHYFAYAQQQLAQATGGQAAAASPLSLLGMVHGHLAGESSGGRSSHTARAIVFHQATLAIDPKHHRSANELGVLWARCGEWAAARAVLLTSLQSQPTPSAWHNLAAVHERLGEKELAQLARNEARLLAPKTPAEAGMPSVEWVDPATFAAKTPADAIPAGEKSVRVSAASHTGAPNKAVRR